MSRLRVHNTINSIESNKRSSLADDSSVHRDNDPKQTLLNIEKYGCLQNWYSYSALSFWVDSCIHQWSILTVLVIVCYHCIKMYPYVTFQTHCIETKCSANSMLALSVAYGLVLKVHTYKIFSTLFWIFRTLFWYSIHKFCLREKIKHMNRATLAMQVCCNKPPISIFFKPLISAMCSNFCNIYAFLMSFLSWFPEFIEK